MTKGIFVNGKIFLNLVEELKELIKGQIIITNEQGDIVASTDPFRIGEFHEGAKLAMENKCKLYMNSKSVHQLKGVREGIVLPIIINNKPIAVLGITGNPEAVEPYARLVKRTAELFIQDNMRQMDEEKQVQDLEFFVFDWLNSRSNRKYLEERSNFFQINIATFTQVIIFKTTDNSLHLSLKDIQWLSMKWNQKRDAIFAREGNGKWLLLIKSIERDVLKRSLNIFLKEVSSIFELPIYVGVGQMVSPEKLHSSYKQAKQAVDIASYEMPVIFEEDLRLEMLLSELSDEVRIKFVERTITLLKDEKVLQDTLRYWFMNDMSTIKTANVMYVHKNTLNYRLRRIEEITNLKFNRINDLVLLYLGYLFLIEIN